MVSQARYLNLPVASTILPKNMEVNDPNLETWLVGDEPVGDLPSQQNVQQETSQFGLLPQVTNNKNQPWPPIINNHQFSID